jgi:hypothetical protein
LRTELQRPAGATRPRDAAELRDGELLFLAPLAHEVSRRFLAEFPDELERYGNAARDWCVHDNQWLLDWAVSGATIGTDLFVERVTWLDGVLAARGYPRERLVRDLELLAEVVTGSSEARMELAAVLAAGADALRRLT